MKKLLSLLLVLLILVGCGGEKAADDQAVVEDTWTLQNENVRKAILYAIDRETLAASLNDGSIPAGGIIPVNLASSPDGVDFREDAGNVTAYDPDLAKEYYKKACEELGKDEITIDFLNGTTETPSAESAIKAADMIQAYLEEVGFVVNRTSKTKKERLALMTDGDYEVSLTRWGPDYADPQTFMDLFVSDNYDNNSGWYNSAEYDALVEDAESGVSAEQRWQDWIAAEKQLVETDAGIIPVFQSGSAMIVRPGITDIQLQPAFVDNFRHIKGQDTITVATATDVLSWDNCIATDGSSFIAQSLFISGLTEFSNNQVKLDLAESYEVSEDGLVYTFKIRDDANWSNGDPVTAADFVFGWDRLVADETASEYSFWLDTASIASYKAIDEKTLEVTLSAPSGIFLQCLAFPCCFPINQKFYESCVDANGNSTYASGVDTVLACGPFILAEWTSGDSYSFKKNENYWNQEEYENAPTKLSFKVIEDSQTGLMAYEQGTLDTVNLSGEQVSANKDHEGYTSSLMGYLFYLSLNINHHE